MVKNRIEKDLIGSRNIPDSALYGIHALRAKENFPDQTAFPIEWYEAVGIVKQACYETCLAYYRAIKIKYPGKKFPFRIISDEILSVLVEKAKEISEDDKFRGKEELQKVIDEYNNKIKNLVEKKKQELA